MPESLQAGNKIRPKKVEVIWNTTVLLLNRDQCGRAVLKSPTLNSNQYGSL